MPGAVLKKPQHVKQAEEFFKNLPSKAFLPKYEPLRIIIDNFHIERIWRANKAYRGFTAKQIQGTPEFKNTLSKTHGIPRTLTDPQAQVVQSQAQDRFMVGANRCGKTMLAALEIAWWAYGHHPHREVPRPPVTIWACCPDYANVGRRVNVPMIRWALGKPAKWKEAQRVFEVQTEFSTEPSIVAIKGYDSGPEKFGGADLTFYSIDEPPPENIYNELAIRLGENPTNSLWTLTPVGSNAPWIYTRLYRPWLDDGRPPEKTFVSLSIDTNTHLDKGDVEKAKLAYKDDPDQEKIRIKGEWGHIGGLLYNNLDADVHLVDDFEIPGVHCPPEPDELPWTIFRFIDPGIRNDCFVGWLAVRPDGLCFVYREWSQADRSIPEVCAAVKAEETVHEKANGVKWTTIDEAAAQRDLGTGQRRDHIFAENGIPCLCASNKEVPTAVSSVREWLRWAKDDQGNWRHEPQVRFFRSCTTLWRQMRNAAWADKSSRSSDDPKEVTKKKDDHGENAIRYLLTNYGGPRWYEPEDHSAQPEELVLDPKTGY